MAQKTITNRNFRYTLLNLLHLLQLWQVKVFKSSRTRYWPTINLEVVSNRYANVPINVIKYTYTLHIITYCLKISIPSTKTKLESCPHFTQARIQVGAQRAGNPLKRKIH